MCDARIILGKIIQRAHRQTTSLPSQGTYNDKLSALTIARQNHRDNLLSGQEDELNSARNINNLEKQVGEWRKRIETEQLLVKNHDYLLGKQAQLTCKILDISQQILEAFHKQLTEDKLSLDQLSDEQQAEEFGKPTMQKQIDEQVKELLFYTHKMLPFLREKLSDFENEHGFICRISAAYIQDNDFNLDQQQVAQIVAPQ